MWNNTPVMSLRISKVDFEPANPCQNKDFEQKWHISIGPLKNNFDLTNMKDPQKQLWYLTLKKRT